MSKVPDAWEDEWSSIADTPLPPKDSESAEAKKISSKVTKAQKRAQQAEFNRQLWAEAEGPKETNFFLESRNVVPLRQEYKAPPVLLSRKGPIIQSPRPPVDGINNLNIKKDESSEDEDEETTRKNALAARQAQAAKDREVKQRKYEERRLELFGPQSAGSNNNNNTIQSTTRSGNSSPGSATPPHSRSTTPNQRGKRGGVGGGRGRGNLQNIAQGQGQQQSLPRIYQQQQQQQRDMFDASYSPKPDSVYIQRQEQQSQPNNVKPNEIQPIRAPRGPDASGRGGFGFLQRPRQTNGDGLDASNSVSTS